MQIKIASVMVDDQDKALSFYTEKLGFRKMADIPMGPIESAPGRSQGDSTPSGGGGGHLPPPGGPVYRWLTVVAPEGIEGVELALEPMAFEPARVFQKALYEANIPATAFLTTDVEAEAQALRERGVTVRGEPVDMGPIKAVMFEDGCGNLIHLVQPLMVP